MKRYAILFCILLFCGCGASRAAHPVVFQNETPPTIGREFTKHFEQQLAEKTAARTVVYKITEFDEGSRFKRMYFITSGAAFVSIWSRGLDERGAVLWDNTLNNKCYWGFWFGGSVYSCLNDIAKRLP